jgi:hypothetical protein
MKRCRICNYLELKITAGEILVNGHVSLLEGISKCYIL